MTEPFTREEVERFNVGHDSSIIKRLASQLLGMMDARERIVFHPEATHQLTVSTENGPVTMTMEEYVFNDGPPPSLEERRKLWEQWKDRIKRLKVIPMEGAQTASQQSAPLDLGSEELLEKVARRIASVSSRWMNKPPSPGLFESAMATSRVGGEARRQAKEALAAIREFQEAR